MATMTRTKSLVEQLTAARQRAKTANIYIACIGFDERGFRAKVTSESDPTTEYTIIRIDGTLVCNCPAQVVCKHIGSLLNEGCEYHTNAIPAAASIGNCVTCGQPATQYNGLVQSDHLDDPMCDACYAADNEQVQAQVARMQAKRQPMPESPVTAFDDEEDEPVSEALLDELLTERAIEAAEDFDASYDAWLDSLPLPLPEPEDVTQPGGGTSIAARATHALLLTDNRPFSLYKAG